MPAGRRFKRTSDCPRTNSQDFSRAIPGSHGHRSGHPRLPDAIYPTTDFLYLRLHGLGSQLYRYDYTDEELGDWVARLQPHLRDRTLYAFFNNDYDANAPRNAATFRELLQRE